MELAVSRHIVVRQVSDHWLAGQLSDNTRKAYSTDIRQFLDWFGSNDLALVCRDDIHRYRAWLVDHFEPASVNRKLSSIRQLFREAVLQRIIDASPAEGIKGHKVDSSYSSTKSPSKEQLMKLIESMSGPELVDIRDKAIIYVMATMGLRRQEVVDLVVSDIQEDQGYSVLCVTGKGNKRSRNPIPPNTLAAVRALIDVANLKGREPLFQGIRNVGGACRLTGKALHANGLVHVIKARFESAGIKDCSPHSLRHFCITEMLRNGCDIYKAQRWVRHADPRTTERYDRAQDDLSNSAASYIGL